jgi:hypothetical protein
MERRVIQATTTPTRAAICAFLDYSDDGVSWTTRGHLFSSTEYTTAEAREFVVSPLGAGRATAKLWGVEFTANNGGGNTRVGELEFRASSGGANLATGGYAGGSNSANGLTNQANQAFDGNLTTRAGFAALPGRLHYNFANAPNPTHYAIRAPNGFANTDAPRDWSVYYSLDGITRTTVATVSGQTGWANSEIREFAL